MPNKEHNVSLNDIILDFLAKMPDEVVAGVGAAMVTGIVAGGFMVGPFLRWLSSPFTREHFPWLR